MEADSILLIRFRDRVTKRSFRLIPGGGIESDETEEECVAHELREETNLEVKVERFLLEQGDPAGFYPRVETYLCRVKSVVPSAGYEPEVDSSAGDGIIETGWFNLRRPEIRNEEVQNDKITCEMLQYIQRALGYEYSSPAMTPD